MLTRELDAVPFEVNAMVPWAVPQPRAYKDHRLPRVQLDGRLAIFDAL
jgi:hypothetical protein